MVSGHPQWDSKRPTDSKQKMQREGRWKGDDWRPEGWSERLEWKVPTPPEAEKVNLICCKGQSAQPTLFMHY